VALNCDGAVAIDKGVADCGGVICDSEGNFMDVFSVYIRLIWFVTITAKMAVQRSISPFNSSRIFTETITAKAQSCGTIFAGRQTKWQKH
jgi:hypothetical protein